MEPVDIDLLWKKANKTIFNPPPSPGTSNEMKISIASIKKDLSSWLRTEQILHIKISKAKNLDGIQWKLCVWKVRY